MENGQLTHVHNSSSLFDVPAVSFFAERVINIWNGLPATVNFSSLSSFKSSIGRVDLSRIYKMYLMPPSCFYFIFFTFNSVSTKLLIVVDLVLSVSFCS